MTVAMTPDRWVSLSMLQKSIRRGHVNSAVTAVEILLQIEPATLWQRLGVIALEDIGLANPKLVGDVTAIAFAGRSQRNNKTPDRAMELVASMSGSTKSRFVDELLMVAALAPELD